MNPRNLLVGLVLMSLFPVASRAAATSPPGVNLRWDQCYADAGVWNKQFACDTNTGSERLVTSFELAQPMAEVSGIEFVIDIVSDGATLPAWWQMRNPGTCRPLSLAFSTLPPPGMTNCVDWSEGNAAGGIGAYSFPAHSLLNAVRVPCVVAVPTTAYASLVPGVEYYFSSLLINHQKTVGTGSCAGCTTPVCIFLSRAVLTTPVEANNVQLHYGANWLGSQYATWQGGYPINVAQYCDSPCLGDRYPVPRLYYTSFDCVLATPTRSRGSTWGEVKSLYR